MLWVTVIGIIIIPVLGWIINAVITRKIDELQDKTKELERSMKEQEDLTLNRSNERFKLIFQRMDDYKEYVEKIYVRESEYKIYREYQLQSMDDKFKSLMSTMTSQFQNVEDKIDELKDALKGNKKGE